MRNDIFVLVLVIMRDFSVPIRFVRNTVFVSVSIRIPVISFVLTLIGLMVGSVCV